MNEPLPDNIKALLEFIRSQGMAPDGRYGPPPTPTLLPDHVRLWLSKRSESDLERLSLILDAFDKEEIANVRSAIKLAMDWATFGRMARWTIITIATAVVAAVSFGEKVATAWKWITGGRGG